MSRIKISALLLPLLFLVHTSNIYASSRNYYWNYVQRGGATSLSSLSGSTVRTQGSYPGATVRVDRAGTSTLATLYVSASGSTKPQPFTASASGFYDFWTTESAVKLTFSGGGLPTTITIDNVSIGTSSGAIGGSNQYVSITSSPYSALPDGSDSGTAITTAINDVSTAGGGTVICPPGNFSVSTVTISASNPVTLTGGCTLTQLTPSNLLPVISIVKSNVTIDGITITGTVAAGHESDDGTADILLTYSGATLTLDGITIKNCHLLGKNSGIESYLGSAANFKITNLNLINNMIRTIYRGIEIGPYAQNAVVNKNITVRDNDIEVSAGAGVPGLYASFVYARAMQIINTDVLTIQHNRAIGGFSSIETYAGTGATSPRPRQHDVKIIDNTTDGHVGFTQVIGGSCSLNTIDLSLRDPSWAAYDQATVVAAWGYLPGIEAADITGCTINGNHVYNQVGAGIQYGASESCTLNGNSVVNSSNTATPWSNGHAIMLYNHVLGGSITGNVLSIGKMSGIGQDDSFAFNDIARIAIVGNTIDSFQRNGIAIHNTAGGNGDIVIANNTISNINLAVSTYSGIDFTPVFGGDQIRGVNVRGNLIDGGKYGIYQPYFEVSNVRGVFFEGNLSRNATTRAFNCYGRRRFNVAGTAGIANAIYSAGHIDTRDLQDDIDLDPGAPAVLTFLDNGAEGDITTVRFDRADTTVTHSANLKLQGSVNVVPTIESIMVFKCMLSNTPTAQFWVEISRSIR